MGQGVLILPGSSPTTATLSFNIIADHVNNLNAGNGFAAALQRAAREHGQPEPQPVRRQQQ
jgi:hypothetical protein